MTGQLLTAASNELFNRPPDEHFASMPDLLKAARHDMDRSTEVVTSNKGTMFDCGDGLVSMSLSNNLQAGLTHYAMLQIASICKVPTDVIARLCELDRTDVAVATLNTLFPRIKDRSQRVLLRHEASEDGAHFNAHAVNGPNYGRLFDYEVFNVINEWLLPMGFKPAFPTLNTNANADNIMGNNKPCLFRGDQTSFGFFFTDKTPEDDGLGGLRHGIMVWNSEVGARSFGWSDFYLQDMCANFLIWGASDVHCHRFIHTKKVREAFRTFQREMMEKIGRLEEQRTSDLTVFARAARTPFAEDEADAIGKLTRVWKFPANRATAVVAAAALPQNSTGNPLSVWNVANGITYEAGATNRAENLFSDSLVAGKLIRKLVTV